MLSCDFHSWYLSTLKTLSKMEFEEKYGVQTLHLLKDQYTIMSFMCWFTCVLPLQGWGSDVVHTKRSQELESFTRLEFMALWTGWL